MKGNMNFSTKRKIAYGILAFLGVTFLCLITNLFAFYKSFLLGVFGLVTYPLVILGMVFCILFLSNKVVRFDKKSLIISISIMAVFIAILQLALTSGLTFSSFGAFVADCYNNKSTPAGALFGIIIYPFKFLLHDVGAYVVFAIAIIVLVAYAIDSYLDKMRSGGRASSAKIERAESKKDMLNQLRDNNAAINANEKQYSEPATNVNENQHVNSINQNQAVNEQQVDSGNKLINEDTKSKFNINKEEVVEDDKKTLALKVLYPDKYKDDKTTTNTLNPNYLKNSLDRYIENKEKVDYSDYVSPKVGYTYVNDNITNGGAFDGIISGDDYRNQGKKNKVNYTPNKEKTDEIFETMKSSDLSQRNYTEKRLGDGVIMTDIVEEQPKQDFYIDDESEDISKFENENSNIERDNSNIIYQYDDNSQNNSTNQIVEENVFDAMANENQNNDSAVNEKENLRPILKVEDEESIEDNEVGDNDIENRRATILPDSDDLALNQECESENEVTDDELFENIEEISLSNKDRNIEKSSYQENHDENCEVEISNNENANTDSSEEIDTLNLESGVKEIPLNNQNDKQKEIQQIAKDENNSSNRLNEFTPKSEIQNTVNAVKVENKKEEKKEEVYIPPKAYKRPPVDFLTVESTDMSELAEDTQHKSEILEQSLESFKVGAKVSNIVIGPTVTRYEMIMPAGVSVKRIINYSDDIAMALESKGAIRIEAPIPGKNAVGVEVPNQKGAVIGFKEVFESGEFYKDSNPLNFVLGKDINGKFVFCNLAKAPHLLVAGSTGSGKSVCLNILILSIIYKSSPEDVRLILVDPKRVEFAIYEGLPHLMLPKIITEPEKVVNTFTWAINEMEKRYTLFQSCKVRDIGEYNQLPDIINKKKPKMPYIVMIVDELADIMSVCKKEVEEKIARIAAKARSAGIHLVLATQRPSIDVITGTIKNNLPTRIAFSLTSYADSKTILDESGAEKLLGRGDMLYAPSDQNKNIRIQAPFVTGSEIRNVVEYVIANNEARYEENIENKMMNKGGNSTGAVGLKDSTQDEMFVPALRVVLEEKQASSSLLQRRLGVGWNRASSLTDAMVNMGYISRPDSNNKRQILITWEQFNQLYGEDN